MKSKNQEHVRQEQSYLFDTLRHLVQSRLLTQREALDLDSSLRVYCETTLLKPANEFKSAVDSYVEYLASTVLHGLPPGHDTIQVRHAALWRHFHKISDRLLHRKRGNPGSGPSVGMIGTYLRILIALCLKYEIGSSDGLLPEVDEQLISADALLSIAKISMARIDIRGKHVETHTLNWLGPLPWLGSQVAKSGHFRVINKWESNEYWETYWRKHEEHQAANEPHKTIDGAHLASPAYALIGAFWIAYSCWRCCVFEAPAQTVNPGSTTVEAATRVAWGYSSSCDSQPSEIDIFHEEILYRPIHLHTFINRGKQGDIFDATNINVRSLRYLTFSGFRSRRSFDFGYVDCPGHTDPILHNSKSKLICIVSDLSEGPDLLKEPRSHLATTFSASDYWSIGNVSIPGSANSVTRNWLSNWKRRRFSLDPIVAPTDIAPYLESMRSQHAWNSAMPSNEWLSSNWLGEAQWSYFFSDYLLERWGPPGWLDQCFFSWPNKLGADLNLPRRLRVLLGDQHRSDCGGLEARVRSINRTYSPIWERVWDISDSARIRELVGEKLS